jgi:hypothetical protein
LAALRRHDLLVIVKCRLLPVNRQIIIIAMSPVADPQMIFCDVFGGRNVHRISGSLHINMLRKWRNPQLLRKVEDIQ